MFSDRSSCYFPSTRHFFNGKTCGSVMSSLLSSFLSLRFHIVCWFKLLQSPFHLLETINKSIKHQKQMVSYVFICFHMFSLFPCLSMSQSASGPPARRHAVTAGAVNAGDTSEFHFHVEGYRSKQAWIMVRATDGTSHWSSERALAALWLRSLALIRWQLYHARGTCTMRTMLFV